jgi:ubiquinone/menaquinone biosynthesis C-methylase UbiE
MAEKKSHSEEYFTEERAFWFNQDFLDLMAKRWELNQYSSLLDIGSGMCHWSKLLVPYLNDNRKIVALDRDEKWAKGSQAIEDYFKSHDATIRFIQGDATALPFADDSFDVVTCQTVLIHLKKPTLALKEMKRVVKPNGIVICSEPNNRIQALLQDTSNENDPIDAILEQVKQTLAIEKYKIQQNEGNNSFGDLVASSMNALGFTSIQCYLNDKIMEVYPPYDSFEQQVKINNFLKMGKSKDELKAFNHAYQSAIENDNYLGFLKNIDTIDNSNKVINAIKKNHFAQGGASILYLISGKK